MTLQDISALSQIVSGLAVVASLVFVGLQIRQNTRATQAASHHAVSEALNRVNLSWAENADVTRIWIAGRDDRQALTEEERWRFDSAMRAYFHVVETMFVQAGLGAGDKDILAAEENAIRGALAFPGVREWWLENTFGFCGAFRGYVGGLM